MNFYEFIGEHYVVATILAIIIGQVITCPFKMYFRHRNIVAKGWPPPHLDADGDLKEDVE